jgi:hypothetical protein
MRKMKSKGVVKGVVFKNHEGLESIILKTCECSKSYPTGISTSSASPSMACEIGISGRGSPTAPRGGPASKEGAGIRGCEGGATALPIRIRALKKHKPLSPFGNPEIAASPKNAYVS